MNHRGWQRGEGRVCEAEREPYTCCHLVVETQQCRRPPTYPDVSGVCIRFEVERDDVGGTFEYARPVGVIVDGALVQA